MPNVQTRWRDYPARWRHLVEVLLADGALAALYEALIRCNVAVGLPLVMRVHDLAPIRQAWLARARPRCPHVIDGATLWDE